ncbi:hypothetical protein [Aquimarina sp. SS2-1]|uniref:hypothetical protein n=1 Tax=Aquimarina besae TaxID=3342247 RepID=UPI0036734598
MTERNRMMGSIRLNENQLMEMKKLGFKNASAYVRHKLQQETSKLEGLQTTVNGDGIRHLSVTNGGDLSEPALKDQLTIQRLSMENRHLQQKLERISKKSEETLNGVQHQVHSMLQEELQKRDHEQLKKSFSDSELKIKALEKNLQDAKKETEEKQKEIEALVKKLGFVELGKALLPGAISGLARQYPNQMKGIAGTLGSLGISDATENINYGDNEDYLLQILNHLSEVFTEEQFEQVVQLMLQLGDQIKDDQGLIQKIAYYLNQLKGKTESKNQSDIVTE